jgi:hypothetical protein
MRPIAFIIQSKDAKLFFYPRDEKNRCIALATELFFEEVQIKKKKKIGPFYMCNW